MKRSIAFSFSLSEEVSKSARIAVTKASPEGRVAPDSCSNKTAATAACDFVQNGHWLREDVNAAINSRNAGVNGAGSRRISWVKRAKCAVMSGL